jgi:hypothetical protein
MADYIYYDEANFIVIVTFDLEYKGHSVHVQTVHIRVYFGLGVQILYMFYILYVHTYCIFVSFLKYLTISYVLM